MAAPFLFIVKVNVAAEQEEAFNDWYNREHLPEVMQLHGCIHGARYRVLDGLPGDASYRYLTLYEFESEEAMRAAAESDYFQILIHNFNEAFGASSTRVRSFFGQIYPEV